jgi:ABC-2 type transport system permease protein
MKGGPLANMKSSWRSIWTLIKLQFKAGIRMPRGKSKSRTVLKYALFMTLAIGGILGFNFIYGTLAKSFITNNLSHELLTFSFIMFHVIETCFMLPMLIRTLDINNDREMLLRWPVSPKQIFISKIIVAYFNEVIFAAVLLTPILIAYGITASMNFLYFLLIPIAVMLAPFFPFFIASLIMYPVQRIVNYLRPRQMLTTFIYFGLLIGFVVGYMEIINGTLFVLLDNAGLERMVMTKRGAIKLISKIFGIQWIFAKLFDQGLLWSVIAVASMIAVSFGCLVGGLVCAGRNYYKTYMDERTTLTAMKKKTPYKKSNPLFATIRKDCLNIFRSSNYTFQFLLLVVLTPLLVYFCNRVAMVASFQTFTQNKQPELADKLIFGASLFVIMILMPVSSSFSASAITREGYNIFHTKLIPVSFRTQIAVKSGIVFFPIMFAVAIATGMIAIPYKPSALSDMIMRVSPSDAAYIWALAMCQVVGYISLGLYLDIRKPLCNQVGQGELTKSTAHVNLIMGVGLGVGALLGIISMFGGLFDVLSGAFELPFIVKALFKIGAFDREIYLPLSAAFGIISLSLLFFHAPSLYRRLEQ